MIYLDWIFKGTLLVLECAFKIIIYGLEDVVASELDEDESLDASVV